MGRLHRFLLDLFFYSVRKAFSTNYLRRLLLRRTQPAAAYRPSAFPLALLPCAREIARFRLEHDPIRPLRRLLLR
jgi:hypothetical protein